MTAMKKNYLLVAFLVISFVPLFGKIKNGYESQLLNAKESLRVLTSLLLQGKDITLAKKQKMKYEIDNLTSYILYYELTEELLHQLKKVSPEIFYEIDNLRDKRGRPTDIMVKFIPKALAAVPLRAASFFAKSPIDEDACHSSYGEYTVAIDISLCEKSLALFCHELGHVRYIVPNLASFRTFYYNKYSSADFVNQLIGHHSHDPSGHSANVFERRFCKDNSARVRRGGEKLESPFSILRKIRKTQYLDIDDAKTIAFVW